MIAFIRRLFGAQSLVVENQQLKDALAIAYISSNFGCFNRCGGECKGAALINLERRRCSSGSMVMVCLDIGGLGALNQLIGESAVNAKVRDCLKSVQAMRGISFVAQLNSGDEFVLMVDSADAEGLIERMRGLFISTGFSGLYAAAGAIDPGKTYVENANRLMELVYLEKLASK